LYFIFLIFRNSSLVIVALIILSALYFVVVVSFRVVFDCEILFFAFTLFTVYFVFVFFFNPSFLIVILSALYFVVVILTFSFAYFFFVIAPATGSTVIGFSVSIPCCWREEL
jgi:hypothetical protein